MTILLDGVFVLNTYKAELIVFLMAALGLGGWARRLTAIEFDENIRLPAALCLGSIVLALISFFLVLLGRVWHPLLFSGNIFLAVIGVLAFWDCLLRSREFSVRHLLIFVVLILGLLIIRLAFLRDILLPPYDDSPEHYVIVRNLLSPGGDQTFYSLENLTTHYYHFGFHGLAAWMSSVFSLDPLLAIPLLGQVFLAIAPVSVYLLASVLTKDIWAGYVSALFAAFAWRMPAFAENWGKYPAIMGLSLFPAVIVLWVLFFQSPGRNRTALIVLIAVTAGLVFIHTRLAICLTITVIAHFLGRALGLQRRILLWMAVCVFVVAMLGIYFLFRDSLSAFYANGYFLPLSLTALLLVVSYSVFPAVSVGILVFVVGVWGTSRIAGFLGGSIPVLLDQPFVDILLYMPLSLSAGLGLIGLLRKIQGPLLRRGVVGLVGIALSAGLFSAGVYHPDACCSYVQESDLQAIHWIQDNIHQDSVVWIAAFKSPNYMIGMDAGVWLRALTGRNVNKLRYDFDWDSSDAIARICESTLADVYIYEGGRPYSFDAARLAEQSWLRRVFASGDVSIYRTKEACINLISH